MAIVIQLKTFFHCSLILLFSLVATSTSVVVARGKGCTYNIFFNLAIASQSKTYFHCSLILLFSCYAEIKLSDLIVQGYIVGTCRIRSCLILLS